MLELINKAKQAAEMSYAPYSGFKVGAAVLTSDGRIYSGCNIENASYGATNCAERTAIFKAVSDGAQKITAVAVTGGIVGRAPVDYAYPCGVCRQVMQEFGGSSLQVIVAKSVEEYQVFTLNELLPFGFGGESIK